MFGVDEITDAYATVLTGPDRPPILVGHTSAVSSFRSCSAGASARPVWRSHRRRSRASGPCRSLLRSAVPVLSHPGHRRKAVALTWIGTHTSWTSMSTAPAGRPGGRPGDDLCGHAYVDFLHATVEHLGLDRVFVLGHSHGGFVAQRVAVRHPDRTAGLALFSTSPTTDAQFWAAEQTADAFLEAVTRPLGGRTLTASARRPAPA
jgi:pimeloyl-ACP methyl ester carboxylesterase